LNTTQAAPPTRVAVSANAGTLAGTVAIAYAGGSFMLAAALLVALVLIVPAERATRRNALIAGQSARPPSQVPPSSAPNTSS
jgi:hypothetical protein